MVRPGTVHKIHTVSVLIREYLHEFLKKFEMVIWDTQGPGETDLWKKLEAENLVSDSL